MTDTIRLLGSNDVLVSVSSRVAKKVMSVHGELAQLGLEVTQPRPAFSGPVVETVKTVWLVYSILKEAKNQWPAIRKILVNAGLSNSEIVTLGLSQYTRKRPARTKKR